MKRIVYLKVSNKTNQVNASYHRDYKPLTKSYAYSSRDKYYPTLLIKLNLDIPESFFLEADKEIDLKITSLNVCDDIIIKEDKEKIKEMGE